MGKSAIMEASKAGSTEVAETNDITTATEPTKNEATAEAIADEIFASAVVGDAKGTDTAAEEAKTETDVAEDKPKFKPDDDFIERAVRAGMSFSQAKGFSSKEDAEAELEKISAKADDHGNGEGTEDEAGESGEYDIPDLDEEEFDEAVCSAFKSMKKALNGALKEIAALKKAGNASEAASFFERQLNGLGEGVAKHIDAAARSKLESKFKILEAGYKAAGQKYSREQIFKEAAQVAIGDLLAKQSDEAKAARIAERNKMAIARPGGIRGNINTAQEVNEQTLAEELFRKLTT